MYAFVLATILVALAEMGDKTQLLAFLLAARFRQPLPIIAGIFVATIINHAGAGALGVWLTQLIGTDSLRWLLGLGFIAMAAWMLIPDKLEDNMAQSPRFGVFGTTLIAFFLAEMGDKTQIATVALSANYAQDFVWVIIGTTLGMMLANVPAVYLGNHFAQKLPLAWIHGVAALIFAVIGGWILIGGMDMRMLTH
ncbi:TMEM165/GDT1 family protein [Agitococcus lubricus]|uniref:GDT1 family protein n=1 Tax=Agitococcus lubricus TaxID=1077255 RepID=A0A2T5J276_9GAMM|nr:TMEM165/GDT1 family protein [Agitococcus lubricus]PTQ90633.1 putative Ca2+/H+ antiporter (TMEM165/GDT1 family) [Agitococcus lubricus]